MKIIDQKTAGINPEKKYPPYSKDAMELETIINDKLSDLAPHSLNYGVVCIYRVPEKHRKKNPEAYTPRLVSIGPLHYGQSQLQRMEDYKLKYLNNFLHTFLVPLGSLTEFVHAQEKLVRSCYENNYVRNLKEKQAGEKYVKLSEVMLLDGVFILELFLKNRFHQLREMGDIIFINPWVSKDIVHDLLLLENQLPLKFVSSLYDSFVYENLKKRLECSGVLRPSFFELVLEYFKDRDVGNTKKLELAKKPESVVQAAQHLIEFLAILHTAPEQRLGGKFQLKFGGKQEQKPEGRKHRWGQKRGEKFELTYCPTVKQLATAGVKITKPAETGKEQYLFEVQFDKETGELTIPPMVINDSTETFLRNLIAFEQTGYHSKYVTSYVILLDNFIDTGKDVHILVEKGIIKNELRTNEQVAEVFNNLYQEVVTDLDEFTYLKICKDLDDYSKNTRHALMSWWANARTVLGRDYFNSPWSVVSVIGAFIVVLLTIMQAIVSLLSLLNDLNKL